VFCVVDLKPTFAFAYRACGPLHIHSGTDGIRRALLASVRAYPWARRRRSVSTPPALGGGLWM